jgi:hypothetical protein
MGVRCCIPALFYDADQALEVLWQIEKLNLIQLENLPLKVLTVDEDFRMALNNPVSA